MSSIQTSEFCNVSPHFNFSGVGGGGVQPLELHILCSECGRLTIKHSSKGLRKMKQ
jgi:hypothetical protein